MTAFIVHGTGRMIPAKYLPEIADYLNQLSNASREKAGMPEKGK